MMLFNIYANSMYCGQLTVTSSGLHIHKSRDNKRLDTLARVKGYKGLNLKRVKQ